MGAPFALGVVVRALAMQAGANDGPGLVTLHLAVSFILLTTGAILTYRLFMTQEAIETEVSLTTKRVRKVGPATEFAICSSKCKMPVWELIKKEIMLQRLPASIAALSVAIVLLVNKDHAAMLSVFYPAVIVILVGSVASADERRMGLIPSQVAHPISFSVQWLIKIGVAYSTALLFGAILPAAVLLIKTDELNTLTVSEALAAAPFICGGTLLLISITIYISSLSESGIRAMLASLFVLIVAVMVIGAGHNAYFQYLWRQMADERMLQFGNADAFVSQNLALQLHLKSFAIATLGFIPLALYFAMRNHRYLERSGLHLIRQVGALIFYEVAALGIIFVSL